MVSRTSQGTVHSGQVYIGAKNTSRRAIFSNFHCKFFMRMPKVGMVSNIYALSKAKFFFEYLPMGATTVQLSVGRLVVT